jgi:hypothetical protein
MIAGYEKGPGLKPLYMPGFFAGLKPCAPSEKANTLTFRSLDIHG